MNLIDIHGNPLRSRADEPSAFEGGQSSGLRTDFLAFPTNPRKEMSRYTRRELARKVRALDANLGIIGRIIRKVGQHSVGKGIFPPSITQDKEWNTANRKRFENRMSNPLLYSVQETYDFWEDQRWAAETMVGDGESFTGLVWKDSDRRTQRYDCFELETPREILPGERWQDGIRTDKYDAPRAYGILEHARTGQGWGYEQQRVRRVPADAMLHMLHQRRAHQGRGLTWFYSGINDAIDCLDLKALEKGTAKLHSGLAVAVRKKKGDAGSNGISGQLNKLLGENGQTRVEENFWRGAAIQYLAEDEGIDLLSSNRPNPDLLAFLEFLYRDIAIAFGISLEVVYNMAALGGATARASLEDAQWLFDMVQDKTIMRHSRRIYIWDTANAMQSGELPVCKDPEWWATAWRGPAKLTVDMGQTAYASIALMKNAALSHVRYHEERAQDAYEEAEEEIAFRSWLMTRCKESGVEYTQLIEPTPGAVTNLTVQQP